MARTVLDTIPNSRLAQYGHYEYDEVRESCYTNPTTADTSTSIAAVSTSETMSPRLKQAQENPDNSPNLLFGTTQIAEEQEAWMSEEVEKIFNIINDPNSRYIIFPFFKNQVVPVVVSKLLPIGTHPDIY